MTDGGWVCRYTIPTVTAVPAPSTAPASDMAVITPGAADQPRILPAPPLPSEAGPPAVAMLAPEPGAEAEARLILRCADASWLSLCLPGDRRRARALKEAADARTAQRLEVTRLLSEGQCDAAVRAALVAGDMNLAREARAFCAPQTN